MSGFKFITELNNDEEKKRLQQSNAPKFNFLTELNPQPITKTSFREEDIFMDAPNNASFLNARKELNFKSSSDNIDNSPIPKQGFWDKVRNYNPESNPVFKAVTAIPNKLYEIPFTQRIITKAGEAVAGPGAYKNADGSDMQPMDTGSKVGNFVGDFVGTGLGFSMPMSGIGQGGKIGTINNVTEDALKPVFNKLPQATNKLGEYGLNALRTGLDFGAGNTIQGLAQGQSIEDSLKSGAEGILQGAAFGTALKGLGDVKANINPKWETTFESKVQPKSARDMTFKKNGELVPQEGLLGLPMPKDYSMKVNELPAGTTPIEVGGYKDNLVPKVTIKKQKNDFIPMQARDYDNVGNTSIKAYQQDNPTVKPFIQQEAEIIKGELERTIKPERGANYVNGEYIGYGNGRITSDTVAQIKDMTGKSYEDINKAVNDIITDHGKENHALAKKIELIIDDRLTNGYSDDVMGMDIPPNVDYIINKANFDEFAPKVQNDKVFSGYVNNKIPVQPQPKQTIENISAANLNKIQPVIDNTKVLPQYAKESVRKPTQPLIKPLDINTPISNNVPLNEAAASTVKPSLGATDRTKSLTQIVSSNDSKMKKGIKETAKDTWDKIYTRFVDVNNPIKKIDENTYIKATNSKNVGGTVDYILQDALVDRQGKKIGESLKSIVKDIPDKQQDDFMNYVLQRHNIDRAREGKAVYTDYTPEQSAKAVSIIEQLHPEYKVLNDRLIKFVRDFETEWGNKSGLISDELWQNLQDTYKNYVPTQRSFDELEKGFTTGNGRGFVDQSNTLKKATGSERDIVNPLENIMNLVNKTVRTARYNEVGQDMLEALRKNPNELKNLAEILPDDEVIGPGIQNVVTVLENGKPVNVRIKNENLLQSLQAINKGRLDDLDNAAKKVTNLFKTLVTQKNPVFAARNIARDIPTAYVNGSEMNPIKFAKDLFKAGKDLATNSERAQQYHAIGGGGSNFFKSNDTAKSLKDLTNRSLIKKAGDAIEFVNNLTESAPRLAEFNRVLDKTGDVQKALFAANDVTTNFSRGGDLTKKADAYVPYLNAGIQGLDKLARQFKNKPIPTTAKGLIGITSFSLVLDQLNKDNPNYQQLDNRTKDNYFIIPDLNNDGKFIKIPKSREYGVMFADLFERTLRASRGEQNSFKGFKDTVKTNFAPANPIEDNIAAPIAALKTNKDFANRDIIPRSLQDLSPNLQYDEKTSEIGKKLGQLTNMSPKQIDYLIRSYSGVIGQLGLPATTKSNYNGSAGSNILKPVTTQFVADRLYSNQAITDFYDNLDNATTKAADKNFTGNIPSDRVTREEKLKNDLTKTSKALSDYNKRIREAEQKNNMDMVRELRLKMVETAQKANKIYSSR